MPDMEKVIKGLECCKIMLCDDCQYDDIKGCSFYLLHDALETIEEQKKQIKELLKEHEAVVRCKDCKWRGTYACFCKARDDVQDDWFCSEGERKEGR